MANDLKKMFNDISPIYDKVNNLLSFYTHKYFKSSAISTLEIKDGYKILDLCCGSGDLIKLIKNKNQNVKIIGLDFSSNMLEIAKNKNDNVEFIEGNVEELPFNDNEFDIVLIGFGLRNVLDKNKALKEIQRVLKKDGQFLHLDFEGKSKFSFLYDNFILFLLRFFVKDIEPYIYLMKSKKDYFTSVELIDKMSEFGFECLNCKKMFLNIVSFHRFKLLRQI